MTKLVTFTVVKYWYNLDASSPSDAHENDTIARFAHEEHANAFCAEQTYLHHLALSNGDYDDDCCSVWNEKTEYSVHPEEIVIFDNVSETEVLNA